MRKYRVCPNPKCPSKKDSKGGFSKVGFKTDAKKDPYHCPHCKKRLPDYIPEVDPNADPDTDSNPITPVKKVRNWNLDPIKNFLGGFIMKAKANWKAIMYALLTLIILTIFVTTYKTLPDTYGDWGSLAVIGIGLLAVAFVLLFTEQLHPKNVEVYPKKWMVNIRRTFLVLSLLSLIAAIILMLLLPETKLNSVKDTVTKPAVTQQTKPEVFSLGVPANPADVDPAIWNKPMNDGVMITGEGIVYYTQSGKKGSKLLKGQIPDGQTLVLDSYSLSKKVNDKVESYSGGNLLVIPGPLDLDKNPISYTDGAAQMIGTIGLQKFLDENIWVKFSRGDALKNNSAWSYKPWALTNKWLPNGYHFKKLGLTKKTDTYPNKIPPTIK